MFAVKYRNLIGCVVDLDLGETTLTSAAPVVANHLQVRIALPKIAAGKLIADQRGAEVFDVRNATLFGGDKQSSAQKDYEQARDPRHVGLVQGVQDPEYELEHPAIISIQAGVIVKRSGDDMTRTQIGPNWEEHKLAKKETETLLVPGAVPWMRYAGDVESGNPNSNQMIDETVYDAKD